MTKRARIRTAAGMGSVTALILLMSSRLPGNVPYQTRGYLIAAIIVGGVAAVFLLVSSYHTQD